MLGLRLLGGLSLACSGQAVEGPAGQRKRLALLALLAMAPDRRVSRDRLLAYLWPESPAARARHQLSSAVYELRRLGGDSVILSERDELRLNPLLVEVDVTAFEEAFAASDHARALSLYTGPFLDGFFLSDSPEFEKWVDRERRRLAATAAKAAEELAETAETRADFGAAVEWWKVRAEHDVYDSRVAFRLMAALEASGNRAAALQHATRHQRLLGEEFGIEPSAEVLALAERLRTEPAREHGPAPRPALAEEGHAPIAPAPAATAAHRRPPPPGAGPLRGPHPRPTRRRYALAGALCLAAAVFGVAWLLARAMERPGAAQDDIARAAAREPGGRADFLSGSPVRRQSTDNIAAYELYLRGSDPTLLRSDAGAREGLAYLHEAIALDSAYADAWAGLGFLYSRLASRVPPPERADYWARAEAAARHAIALDEGLAGAHAALGAIRMRFFDTAGAERHLTRAIELDPASSFTYEWLVALEVWKGNREQALAYARQGVAADPLSATARAQLAYALLHNDRCDEALIELEKLAGLQPPPLRTPLIAAQCYAGQRLWPQAIAVLRPQAAAGEPHALALLGYMLARAGQDDEALRIRDTLLQRARLGDANGYHVAVIYAGLGDSDQALAWIDRSITDRATPAVPGATVAHIILGPLTNELQRDPRAAHMRARLGLHRAVALPFP